MTHKRVVRTPGFQPPAMPAASTARRNTKVAISVPMGPKTTSRVAMTNPAPSAAIR